MRTILKWTARVGTGCVALFVVACAAVFFTSQSRLGRTFEVRPAPVPIARDAASIERARLPPKPHGNR